MMKIEINKVFNEQAKRTLLASLLAVSTLGLSGCDLLDQESPVEDFQEQPDTKAPVISLTGGAIELLVGDSYVDPGVSAQDNIDGDISTNVVISDTLDMSTAGTYTLTYNVADAAGNPAEQLSRSVVVLVDTDGDRVGDIYDAFPADVAASIDTDNDGSPDSWNEGSTAEDSTTGLMLDVFPSDPLETMDSDGDGVGDNSDAFPNDPTKSAPDVAEVAVADALLAITDAALKTCLETTIATGDGTNAYTNVSQLTSLDCSGTQNGNLGKILIDANDPGITTLAGLDGFTAITSVKMSYNIGLTDISALSSLDLKVLKLDWTAINNDALEVIANLTNLTVLNLNGAYLIKDGVRATEVLATLEKMEEIFVLIVGSDVYGSDGNTKKITQLQDGKLGDFSYVANMPKLKIFISNGHEYVQGIEGLNSTPLVNNINLNNVKWKANVDLSPLMTFDKAGLNVLFLQGGTTTPICDTIFDVVQHFAPDGVDARDRASYGGANNDDMLLAPPATNRFIRLDNVCLNTL